MRRLSRRLAPSAVHCMQQHSAQSARRTRRPSARAGESGRSHTHTRAAPSPSAAARPHATVYTSLQPCHRFRAKYIMHPTRNLLNKDRRLTYSTWILNSDIPNEMVWPWIHFTIIECHIPPTVNASVMDEANDFSLVGTYNLRPRWSTVLFVYFHTQLVVTMKIWIYGLYAS